MLPTATCLGGLAMVSTGIAQSGADRENRFRRAEVLMKADENRQQATVAERPRGFNGIPEPGELAEPDVTVAASHIGNRVAPVRDNQWPGQSWMRYPEWIAGMAVVAGTVAAIAGTARELASRSRARESTRCRPSEPAKHHGDKLVPHGRRGE